MNIISCQTIKCFYTLHLSNNPHKYLNRCTNTKQDKIYHTDFISVKYTVHDNVVLLFDQSHGRTPLHHLIISYFKTNTTDKLWGSEPTTLPFF